MALNVASKPFKTETGAQLLSRLESRPTLVYLESAFFPELKPGSVVEISGDANVGKSELLYHFIIKCIFPESLNGLNVEVVIIDTDGHFDVLRLINIMEQRIYKTHGQEEENESIVNNVADFIPCCLSRLHVVTCTSMENLIITLHHCKYIVGSNINIACIMIDSVSAFYWSDRGKFAPQYKKLDELYTKLVEVLKQIISDYSVTIIAVKQNLAKPRTGYSGTVYDFMGYTWQKFVSHRLQMMCDRVENCKTFLQIKHIHGNEEPTHAACITDAGIEIL